MRKDTDSVTNAMTKTLAEAPARLPDLPPIEPTRSGFFAPLGRLMRDVSAIPLFIVLFVIFAILVPQTFLTPTTWLTLLNGNSMVAIAALGLTVALAAGVFDVSIGTTIGLGAVGSAWLMSNTGLGAAGTIAVTLAVGVLVGLLNAFLVVVVGIDSFIATLGVSSVLTATVLAISNGQQIIGLDSSFTDLGGVWLFGITGPVYVLLLIAVVTWYVLQRTSIGRRIYATGTAREAARLAGVKTKRIMTGALVTSALFGTLTGVLIAAQYGTGDPSTGPDFLLPAFAAAFLGSTQFGRGRFNVWGTMLAVYVLAVGVKGLQLVGVSFWVPALFNGVALLAAVGFSRLRRRKAIKAE